MIIESIYNMKSVYLWVEVDRNISRGCYTYIYEKTDELKDKLEDDIWWIYEILDWRKREIEKRMEKGKYKNLFLLSKIVIKTAVGISEQIEIKK